MGLAKQLWIEEQELQPMYEWIEDNYGDDINQDNEDEWNEAVGAYNNYVDELQRLEELQHAAEEYDYYIYITLKDIDDIFDRDIDQLRSFVNQGSSNVPDIFYKMSYAHAVTIFEVYMEDMAKTLITNNDAFLDSFVLKSKIISRSEFSLKDILVREDEIKCRLSPQNLRKEALTYLSSILYHDIPKLINLFECILQRKITLDEKSIKRITHIRHDIVHRNGKNKNGESYEINKDIVIESIDCIKVFSESVRREISTFKG